MVRHVEVFVKFSRAFQCDDVDAALLFCDWGASMIVVQLLDIFFAPFASLSIIGQKTAQRRKETKSAKKMLGTWWIRK
jgi:hypothetical protein